MERMSSEMSEKLSQSHRDAIGKAVFEALTAYRHEEEALFRIPLTSTPDWGALYEKHKEGYRQMGEAAVRAFLALRVGLRIEDAHRPTIVCLCGSTRFSEAYREANLRETLAGKIVLSIGCEWHGDQALGLTEADKERLDALHLKKVELADEILVLNIGGYVGDSTRREIEYAKAQGKRVRYLSDEASETKEQAL
jgi:hypothetical protein